MSTSPCYAALRLTLSPLPSISSRAKASRVCFGASVGVVRHFKHVDSRKCPARVVRIRGFAGEGGATDKEETAASTSTGENGKSGTAVADLSSSPSGSTKGFGASAWPGGLGKSSSKEKKKSATIRRSAPQQPLIQAPADNQMSQIETAYVVSLTFLFGLIFVEGIALAASGFLPEEWDQFLVNTLYPSFTPTVGLFLLAAAGYGVFKYLGLGPPKE